MNISVVIPSYNSQRQLPATLAALDAQTTRCEFEVLVVDCSDDPEGVSALCEPVPRVRFQHVTERFNPGIGRNLGAQAASGALLVFVDADVQLEPSALQAAWEYADQGNKAFGGALELNEREPQPLASHLEHLFFNHESQQGRPVCPRSNLSSALMIISRETFLQAGGFKDIPRMQDTEFTERLRQNGVTLSFNPRVVGLQTQDSPLGKVLRKIYINGKNLYFIRYQAKPAAFRAALGVLLPGLSAMKVLRIIGRHLRYQTVRKRGITVAISPLLALAGSYWMAGLYRSMLFGGQISAKRE